MKKTLLIVFIGLLSACGGSKNVIQNNNKAEVTQEAPETTIAKEKKDSVKIANPVEEKAPESPLKKPEIKKEPKAVSKILTHYSWNKLLEKYVSTDGTVNYKGFKNDQAALKSYLSSLRNNMPAQNASKAYKLAYWLNVYNAYTVKLIIDNYPIKSIKDIKDPWDLRFFRLGKKWYTLNDVEHRILRKMKDPRIHFGINCASFSCPPLPKKAFTAKNVDNELEKLAITFINDSKRNTIEADRIELSKIFSWFAKDFKTNGSLINFLNKYSKIKINNSAKKSFKTYDWTLNE